ncbi:MAG: DUF484 family protein [Pseudomonadota bacterium]
MAQTELKEGMVAQDLVAFFRENPDIFQRHPELLELVTLSDNRGTASLLERQIATLKERLQRFQSQQFELIEVARENEQISDSFSEIICQLIGFANLSEFASEFPTALRKTFEIDEVAFKTRQAVQRRPDELQAYEDTLRRVAGNKAVCDNRWPANILSLFFGADIRSAALIPMIAGDDSEVLGVLALGSQDPERYTHELGTAHLNRLGLMAGICLARLQPSS